jgi:GNAT superfamily N-acetyltransferase
VSIRSAASAREAEVARSVGWRDSQIGILAGVPSLKIDVRTEQRDDVDAIRRLNEVAFGTTAEADIVDDIRGTDAWIDGGSVVAIDGDGRLVGHLLLSMGRLIDEDGTDRPIWMLGPVAVLPELQRRGVGRRLMQAAIDLAIAIAPAALIYRIKVEEDALRDTMGDEYAAYANGEQTGPDTRSVTAIIHYNLNIDMNLTVMCFVKIVNPFQIIVCLIFA